MKLLTTPILLGLTGKKRAGKDSVYQAIRDLGINAERIAFADALKRELANACGVDLAEIEAHKATYRLGLQWWGTEFRRGRFDDDYWIDRLDKKYQRIKGRRNPPELLVVTDVRFPNEVDWIRNNGGIVWRVERPLPLKERIKGLFKWEHASEKWASKMKVDAVICNGGPLAHLRCPVKFALLNNKFTEHLFPDGIMTF